MSLRNRATDRIKSMTLIEVLLALLLLCAYGIFARLGEVEDRLTTVNGSLEDIRNEVDSESADIQTKLDEQKDILGQIDANLP